MNDKFQWLKTAYTMDSCRPVFHFVSRITTAMFCLMALYQSGIVSYFLELYPKTCNIVCFTVCYACASVVEGILERIIEAFSFVCVRGKSGFWYAVPIGIVAIPLFLISAVTSYSGIKGNLDTKDLGLDKINASIANAGINKDNAAKTLKQDLAELIKSREYLRKTSIGENEKRERDAANKNCRTMGLEGKAKMDCINENDARITQSYIEKYETFDNETRRQIEQKQALINQTEARAQKDKERMIDAIYSETDGKYAWIVWVASLLGWVTVCFEAFSLVACIITYKICYDQKIDVEEMRKEGAKIDKRRGIFISFFHEAYNFFFKSRKA